MGRQLTISFSIYSVNCIGTYAMETMLEVGDKDLFEDDVFLCPLISGILRLTTKSSMHSLLPGL